MGLGDYVHRRRHGLGTVIGPKPQGSLTGLVERFAEEREGGARVTPYERESFGVLMTRDTFAPYKGWWDLHCHGTSEAFYVVYPQKIRLSIEQVINALQLTGYNGSPIRCLSCHGGEGPALQLARALNVAVVAAIGTVQLSARLDGPLTRSRHAESSGSWIRVNDQGVVVKRGGTSVRSVMKGLSRHVS